MPRNPVHPLRSALATAGSTSIGVGLGVLLGGYLTAVSGQGAPGAGSLGTADLAVLPAYSASAAFAVVLLASLGLSALRRARLAAANRADDQPDRDKR